MNLSHFLMRLLIPVEKILGWSLWQNGKNYCSLRLARHCADSHGSKERKVNENHWPSLNNNLNFIGQEHPLRFFNLKKEIPRPV